MKTKIYMTLLIVPLLNLNAQTEKMEIVKDTTYITDFNLKQNVELLVTQVHNLLFDLIPNEEQINKQLEQAKKLSSNSVDHVYSTLKNRKFYDLLLNHKALSLLKIETIRFPEVQPKDTREANKTMAVPDEDEPETEDVRYSFAL